PVTVRLQKFATLRGRLVDEKGKPRPGARLIAGAQRGQAHVQLRGQTTDRAGRFRLEGVIPGMKVRVWTPKVANVVTQVIPEVILKAGEAEDVGGGKARGPG